MSVTQKSGVGGGGEQNWELVNALDLTVTFIFNKASIKNKYC